MLLVEFTYALKIYEQSYCKQVWLIYLMFIMMCKKVLNKKINLTKETRANKNKRFS